MQKSYHLRSTLNLSTSYIWHSESHIDNVKVSRGINKNIITAFFENNCDLIRLVFAEHWRNKTFEK